MKHSEPTSRDYIPLSKLPLSHDYMFWSVMRDEYICKRFLEELLQVRIGQIKYLRRQAKFKDRYDGHGIQLDVYLRDDAGTMYSVEMQAVTYKALEKRCRYYQSGMDRSTLDSGKSYEALAESYVIFICDYDKCGQGLAVYRKSSVYEGLPGGPQEDFDDGSHVFVLNSRYTVGNASDSVLEFLRLVRDEDFIAKTELGRMTRKAVDDVRQDKGKEAQYLLNTYEMRMNDVRTEGFDKGHAEGVAEGRAKGHAEGVAEGHAEGIGQERRRTILLLRESGMSDAEIAMRLKLSCDDVSAVQP